MNKKNITIILIISFIILGSIFFLGQNSDQGYSGVLDNMNIKKIDKDLLNSEDIERKTNTDMLGWNTYTNEEYGFEFKYPKEWKIYSEKKEEIELVKMGSENNDMITIIYLAKPKPSLETDSLNLVQGVVEDYDSKFGHIMYFFNEQENKWKKSSSDENSEDLTVGDADMSLSTDSELPVFVGKKRWLTYIVPLTKITFLKLNITGSGMTEPLLDITKTVQNINIR